MVFFSFNANMMHPSFYKHSVSENVRNDYMVAHAKTE